MTQSNTRPDVVQDDAASPGVVDRPDLSIVIVSWNVTEQLMACLRTLQSDPVREGLSLEVIVVDNASTDGSAQAAHDMDATVIANRFNLGYGRANNLGLRRATGRHLLILNPDTIPQPGSLSTLIAFAECNPQAGIVAPRLLNPDGAIQSAAFRFPTLPMALLDLFPPPAFLPGRLRLWVLQSRLNGRYPEETGTTPHRIDHPLGACLLIKREAYEMCGGFDEHIFMYSEEIDLAMRYAQEGWQAWQEPNSEVVHLGGQSTRQLPDRMFVELWRSRLYIYDRYYTPAARLGIRVLLVAAMLRNIVMSSWRGLSGRQSPRQMHGQVRNWARVLRLAVRP